MKKISYVLVCGVLLSGLSTQTQAQGILKRLKDKAAGVAERAAGDVIEKKMRDKLGVGDGNAGNTAGPGSSSPSSGRNNPSNKGGAGLVTTPPDVKENLKSAETAYKASSFADARSSIQQAMLGVEMEIGKKILVSLPETVVGLKAQKETDQVTSTGWGWVGLTIYREYREGDKQLRTTIANNTVWMAAINMFLTNGTYAQQSNGDQKWKQTKVKGNKAVIEYDESSGYKLTVPIGQSSLIIWEGVNFANEQEMMSAAESFDIDGIKTAFGEK